MTSTDTVQFLRSFCFEFQAHGPLFAHSRLEGVIDRLSRERLNEIPGHELFYFSSILASLKGLGPVVGKAQALRAKILSNLDSQQHYDIVWNELHVYGTFNYFDSLAVVNQIWIIEKLSVEISYPQRGYLFQHFIQLVAHIERDLFLINPGCGSLATSFILASKFDHELHLTQTALLAVMAKDTALNRFPLYIEHLKVCDNEYYSEMFIQSFLSWFNGEVFNHRIISLEHSIGELTAVQNAICDLGSLTHNYGTRVIIESLKSRCFDSYFELVIAPIFKKGHFYLLPQALGMDDPRFWLFSKHQALFNGVREWVYAGFRSQAEATYVQKLMHRTDVPHEFNSMFQQLYPRHKSWIDKQNDLVFQIELSIKNEANLIPLLERVDFKTLLSLFDWISPDLRGMVLSRLENEITHLDINALDGLIPLFIVYYLFSPNGLKTLSAKIEDIPQMDYPHKGVHGFVKIIDALSGLKNRPPSFIDSLCVVFEQVAMRIPASLNLIRSIYIIEKNVTDVELKERYKQLRIHIYGSMIRTSEIETTHQLQNQTDLRPFADIDGLMISLIGWMETKSHFELNDYNFVAQVLDLEHLPNVSLMVFRYVRTTFLEHVNGRVLLRHSQGVLPINDQIQKYFNMGTDFQDRFSFIEGFINSIYEVNFDDVDPTLLRYLLDELEFIKKQSIDINLKIKCNRLFRALMSEMLLNKALDIFQSYQGQERQHSFFANLPLKLKLEIVQQCDHVDSRHLDHLFFSLRLFKKDHLFQSSIPSTILSTPLSKENLRKSLFDVLYDLSTLQITDEILTSLRAHLTEVKQNDSSETLNLIYRANLTVSVLERVVQSTEDPSKVAIFLGLTETSLKEPFWSDLPPDYLWLGFDLLANMNDPKVLENLSSQKFNPDMQAAVERVCDEIRSRDHSIRT